MHRRFLFLARALAPALLAGAASGGQDAGSGWGAVFRIAPSGEITVVASAQPFMGPRRIAVNASGNYLIADSEHYDDLFEVTPGGAIHTVPLSPYSGVMTGLAVDASGDCVLGSYNKIFRLSTDGRTAEIVDLEDDPGDFTDNYIDDIVIDPSGNYLCAVHGEGGEPFFDPEWRLYRVTPGGDVDILLEEDETSPLYDARVVAVAPDGKVFAATADAIYRSANSVLYGGEPLEDIGGIAVDPAGDIIVADAGNKTRPAGALFRVTQGGAVSGIAGGTLPFMAPADVAMDGNGNYIVADELAGRPLFIQSAQSVFPRGYFLSMNIVVQPLAEPFDAWAVIETPSGSTYSIIPGFHAGPEWSLAPHLRKGAAPVVRAGAGLGSYYQTVLMNGRIEAGTETGRYAITVGLVPPGVPPAGPQSAIPGYVDVQTIEITP